MKGRKRRSGSNLRRGSLAVTLTLFFVSLLLLLGTLTEAASGVCAGSLADGVLRIAGRSVLSEYDRDLWRYYGLLGVRTDGVKMEEALQYYLKENLEKSHGLIHLKAEEAVVDFDNLLLTCPDVLEKEIVEYMVGRVLLNKVSELDGEMKVLREGVKDGTSGTADADFIRRTGPVMLSSQDLSEKVGRCQERWNASKKTDEDRALVEKEFQGLKEKADHTLELCEQLTAQKEEGETKEGGSVGETAALGVEQVKEQLKRLDWGSGPELLFSQFPEREKLGGDEKEDRQLSDLSTEQEFADKGGTSEVVLRNKTVIEGLPSVKMEVSAGVLSGLDVPWTSGAANAAMEIRSNYYTNQYIRLMFRDRMDKTDPIRATLFQNEIEYLLCGGYSDQQNGKKVSAYLLAFRTGMNLTTIYADSSKREALTALAVSMAPGPASILAQAILAGIWAAAEGVNDVRLLLAGEKVPVWKTQANWALPLECVFEVAGGSPIRPAEVKGSDYKDYLVLFLNLLERETKLVRMMDLIQLNLKGNCDESFEMSDCAGGFHSNVLIKKASGFPSVLPKGFRERNLEQTQLY